MDVKLVFQPMVMEQKRSTRETFQKTRRLSSCSAQSFGGPRYEYVFFQDGLVLESGFVTMSDGRGLRHH
jgi:hypothetical protein